LYHLEPTARVDDAVKAAGGPTEDADVDQLNLAGTVEDGSQIHVPAQGEVLPVQATKPTRSSHGAGTVKANGPVGQISLNSASAAELDQLPGVGPATAQKIIEYRNANGGFKAVDELQHVKGIGPKKYAKMAPFLAL
jgi:competence protein ComEA